jgi:peptidoglycan/LPS O-acetylase OafA/YrhL
MVCVNCPQGVQIEAIGYLTINLIIAFALLKESKISQWLILFGKYSYFMYFAHFIVLRALVSVLNSQLFHFNFAASQLVVYLLMFTITFFISFLLAIPSYKYIEKPIIIHAR